MSIYKQNFSSPEEAEKDYVRLQAVLAKLDMYELENHTFQTFGGAGKSSNLLGCPGVVKLNLANWDRKDWEVSLELIPNVIIRGK